MNLKRVWLAQVLVLALLGGAFGLALLTGSAQGTPRNALGVQPTAIAPEATLLALLGELEALRGELSELRLAAMRTEGTSERRAIAPAAEPAVHLDEVVRSPHGGATDLDAAAEPRAPRPPAERTLLHREALGRLATAGEDASRGHRFWSYQRVLDAYGPPDQMHATQEGGLTWLYGLGEEGRDAGFVFFDGFVIRVWS